MSKTFDPIVMQIGTEWIIQYARFLRRAPEVVKGLHECPDDFVLVPMPTELLENIGTPSPMVEKVDPAEKVTVRDRMGGELHTRRVRLPIAAAAIRPFKAAGSTTTPDESVLARIREFARALESGEIEVLQAVISPNFSDADGRSASEITAELVQLIHSTSRRRLVILDLEERKRTATEAVGTIDAVWDAEVPDGEVVTERLRFDITLRCGPEGSWLMAAWA